MQKQPSLMIKSYEIAYLISKPNMLDHFKDTEKKFSIQKRSSLTG